MMKKNQHEKESSANDKDILRAVKTRSELAVLMQNNRPESVLKWQGIGDVKAASAFLLQLIDDEEFAECLNLEKKS